MTNLNDLKNQLSEQAFGMSLEDSKALNVCVSCKQPPQEKIYTVAGWKEYHISGLCEECFDAIFNEEE